MLTLLPRLSERVQVMPLHRMVTGRTSAETGASSSPAGCCPSSSSSSSPGSGRAGPAPDIARKKNAAASAASMRPSPLPSNPTTISSFPYPLLSLPCAFGIEREYRHRAAGPHKRRRIAKSRGQIWAVARSVQFLLLGRPTMFVIFIFIPLYFSLAPPHLFPRNLYSYS